MRLDYAITIADPKSVNLLFTAPTTKSELNKTDVMVALGILQARQSFGLNLILAKYTKDKESNKRSSQELNKICQNIIPQQIRKKAYKNLKLSIYKLCEIAINDYCRTADSGIFSCRCKGRGVVGVAKMPNKTVMIDAVFDTQVNRQAQMKECPRCNGKGIRRIPSVKIYDVMQRFTPITKNDWARYWKPFYDELIAFCEINESEAEKEFIKITV